MSKGGGGSSQHQVTFFTPETPGRVVYTLYVMSDAYLGLDQQYDLCLEVVEGYEEVRQKVAPQAANLVYMESACKAHHGCKPNLCS